MDSNALNKLGYGLYVLTAREGEKDNGCIINSAMQVSNSPPFFSVVAVNKQNYTHDMILRTGKFNLSVLTTETPFDLFERFGFHTGASYDKFPVAQEIARSKNGLIYLPKYTNAYLSCDVEGSFDFGSHTLFKCDIAGGETLSNAESVTYYYYQNHIKPRPQPTNKTGYRCVICNYVYEGDTLPADFICPLCKHGWRDFVKIS